MPKINGKGRTLLEQRKLDEYSLRVLWGRLAETASAKGSLDRGDIDDFMRAHLEYTFVPAKRAIGRIAGMYAGGKWNREDQVAFTRNNPGLAFDIERFLKLDRAFRPGRIYQKILAEYTAPTGKESLPVAPVETLWRVAYRVTVPETGLSRNVETIPFRHRSQVDRAVPLILESDWKDNIRVQSSTDGGKTWVDSTVERDFGAGE